MKNRGVFKRDAEELQKIHLFLKGHLDAFKVQEKEQHEIELSVEEVFMNMVRHNAASDKDIDVLVEKKDGEIILSMSDHEMVPFDLTQIDEINFEDYFKEKKSGGLGIHLIKSLMDEIHFTHERGISTITMTKLI